VIVPIPVPRVVHRIRNFFFWLFLILALLGGGGYAFYIYLFPLWF
jgi:hypothetical protein